MTEDIADPFNPKKAGDVMPVDYIDDANQIHGAWQSGGSLAIIIGQDSFEVM